MVKLNKKKVQYIVSQRKKGKESQLIAQELKISQRRVQQIFKEYLRTKIMPELKKGRRPSVQLTDEQKKLIEEVYQRERIGARLLKIVLDQEYPNNRIAKNKIYHYMLQKHYTHPNKKKQEQRKRCRYERTHAGSLLHIDTHYCKWDRKRKLIAVLDDASRKILAAGEFSTYNAQLAIKVMKESVQEAWKSRLLIQSVNSDRGTEFFANTAGKKQRKRHEFLAYLDTQGIRHIPSRVQNPQTNGKLERWFQEYEKHRTRFSTLEEFISWYNNRFHGSVMTTPQKAFWNKIPSESLIGLLFQEAENETKK